MERDLKATLWGPGRYREAFEALILRSGLPLAAGILTSVPDERFPPLIPLWARRAPREMGLEATDEQVLRKDLLASLQDASGPHLLVLTGSPAYFLGVIFHRPRFATLVLPGSQEIEVSRAELYEFIIRTTTSDVDELRKIVGGTPSGQRALERALVESIGGSYVVFIRLELDGVHPIVDQMRHLGAWRSAFSNIALSVLRGAVALGAMWTLGSTAIDGRVDLGLVVAWCMLSFSDTPLQYLASRAEGTFSVAFLTSLKRRLLEGTFFVSETEVRSQGYGDLLARGNEASSIEQLSLGEVAGVVVGTIQAFAGLVLLAKGAAAAALVSVWCFFAMCAAGLIYYFVRSYWRLYKERLVLTDTLVEKIIAHRTRAVQENESYYHPGEDEALTSYLGCATRSDTAQAFTAVLGRIWLVVSSVPLLVEFVARASPTSLLWSALGIMLTYAGFSAISPASQRVAQWITAWRGIRSLVVAGRIRERPSKRADGEVAESELPMVMSASAVSFAYKSGGRPILTNINLSVRKGEKVLLEGSSGSGKTTLLKLIAGERQPTGGVILVDGSDCFAVSQREWRRRVGSAPQFHENYVFSNTFAHNVDPSGTAQLLAARANAICAELGLAPLLEKMPQGMSQIVGETGWQLSHGERSRLFIARALLQDPELMLFDESFAALDPETLLQVLRCVRERARALIVIAHA